MTEKDALTKAKALFRECQEAQANFRKDTRETKAALLKAWSQLQTTTLPRLSHSFKNVMAGLPKSQTRVVMPPKGPAFVQRRGPLDWVQTWEGKWHDNHGLWDPETVYAVLPDRYFDYDKTGPDREKDGYRLYVVTAKGLLARNRKTPYGRSNISLKSLKGLVPADPSHPFVKRAQRQMVKARLKGKEYR